MSWVAGSFLNGLVLSNIEAHNLGMAKPKEQRLYRDLAEYYDLIYSDKDYKAETDKVRALIGKHKKTRGKDLLEVACGTGGHVKYLKGDFKCTAVDLNAEILKVARKKTKGVAFKQADMIKLNLGKRFDVIVCLFSSIGYVRTYANLEKTIKKFAEHLKTGGVVIIEPWIERSIYQVGRPTMDTYEDDDIKIARSTVAGIRGNISVMDMYYQVAERNKGVRHFVDRHELGMFDSKKFLEIMERNELDSKFLKNGLLRNRGLYVGVKR